ncbi:MAG: hypothetical protein J7521_10345 [Caulobacter sp.]|nr:hypothetical protein [Caulobacter sp.]
MTDTLAQAPSRPWLTPLILVLTAWPAGRAGGHGLFKVVVFIAQQQGCETCVSAINITPTPWSLAAGVILLLLASAWIVFLVRFVIAALKRRTHSLAYAALALALLGLFAWASR